ncbi:EamA family transporter [Amycolatopsis sp., V23-08]|uniref:EamA family transporter n=1 Tax=Amycolatopsis heterodermiae TaxID=3110235 RepID=A0ABU5R834_9PSEU|nr:EamA family transporter [Amycolatopsis sp., V23-08]MEA5362381.1 EamA family transporter [Amycolatopsis sp., V23-08]
MQAESDRPADRAVLPAKPRAVPTAGVYMMLTSGLSTQLGAAIGSLAFPVLGPVGVVAVRQCVAAAVLLILGRPRLRSFTRRQWGPVLLLAVVFGVVNLSLYTAIDRIGLGLAVTLEFLGPLTIALAGSRRRVDLGCAVLAVAGVAVLMRPRPTNDYLGMGLALLAAACWAAYILLNRSIGQRIPGAQGTAAAVGLSAVVYLPIGAGVVVHHVPSAGVLGAAVAAGILSSAVPFLADLFTLRRVPAEAFGLFMSVNPVFAAALGALVLRQHLDVAAWLSIVAVVAANAISVLAKPRSLHSHKGDSHARCHADRPFFLRSPRP